MVRFGKFMKMSRIDRFWSFNVKLIRGFEIVFWW